MASVLTEQHNNISRHDSMQRAIAWKDATKKQAADNLRGELDALLRTVKEDDSKQLWEKQFHGYQSLFNKYLVEKPFIDWSKIQPLPAGSIQDYGSLPEPSPDVARQLLKRLVVVKLNGGLGTSMGCKGPKSTIVVREDLTFLDMTMQQIEHLNTTYGQDVPLVLMNSFNTDDDTKKVLQKYRNVQVKVVSFNQSQYPRINKETLLPIVRNVENSHIDDWYPPGHGDFYESFYNSGQLNYFLQSGRDIAFISNIDNLGATVDLRILHNMLSNGESQNDFVMEVTDKTRADVKGGTLVGYQDRLRLLEIAQVPKEHVDDFKSVSKFKIFNTNNLWCNLRAVSDHVSKGRMDMEVIVNPKVTDNGIPVIQLETAIGAAIKNFKGAIGVNVPRARFLPVKKTQDLLLVMSNLYDLDNGHLTLSHLRSFSSTPLVKLGTSYDKVHHFISRFAGVPDLLELDHLTVSGDVTFGRNVSLKGTVIIVASHGDRIDIPAGALLENKIVSGNLRILDH